jgi:hypothetical protein
LGAERGEPGRLNGREISPATSSLRPASTSASSILDRSMADATDDRRIGTVISPPLQQQRRLLGADAVGA